MKKAIVIVLSIYSSSLFAQKMDAAKVPAAVTGAFSKNFPGTTDVKWEQEKGNYEANFKSGGQKQSATFAANGTWLETETPMAMSTLPTAITTYISKNYKGAKIKEAATLKMPNNVTNYEAEVNGMDLIFDSKGTFIKAQKD